MIWSLLCITNVLAAIIREIDSNTVTALLWEWGSTELQRSVVLNVRSLNSDLVPVMHHRRIRSFCRQMSQQYCHRPILTMSVNEQSKIVDFTSWVIYVPIGCIHPFMRYWHPLRAKTTATCSLPHAEHERQWSINSFRSCIFHNQGIAQILLHITELLTTLIGKNSIYQR